jgi:hypothetical protein
MLLMTKSNLKFNLVPLKLLPNFEKPSSNPLQRPYSGDYDTENAYEIAWSNALVLQHRLACRVSAKSSVTVLVLSWGIQGLGTNPTALGSAGGDVASGYVLQERGAERCIFVRFDLTTYTRSIEKGRVNPSPGGWVG